MLCVSLGVSTVEAQEPPADGYRVLITQALEEFEGQRWAEARALFVRAHAMHPNARTFRGIGMASFELREYAAALDAFDAALASEVRPLTEAQRAHVQGLRTRAEAFTARLQLDIEPAEARLDVDGVPTEASDELVLDLGTHTLRMTAPGHRPWTRSIHVVGGERESVAVRLRREPSDPVPAQQTVAPDAIVPNGAVPNGAALDPAATGPESAPPAPSPSDNTAGLALVIAGAATVVATGLPIGWWVEREGALGACAERPCTNVGVLREQRDVAIAVSISAFTVGAALGVLGALLWTDEAAPGRSCLPQGPGVRCRF